jgi:AcrR family transcriptional regulator
MKRLTRDESRARTRARLIDAAGEVFLRRGFEGASLEEIAEEAGYTRGALYSNFRDKDEVFLEVVEEHFTQEVGSVERIFSAEPTPEGRVLALQEWHTAHLDDEEAWTSLILEFWLYALRNPAVRPRIAEMERRVRDAVAALIERQLRDMNVSPPISARDLASIVVALDCGIAGQRFVDPEGVGANVFGSALMLLTAGVAAVGGKAPRKRNPPHPPARRRSR